MAIQVYPQVTQLDAADTRVQARRLALVINLAMQGKINCAIEVTLATGTSTVVNDERLHPSCLLFFDPLNSIADTAMRVGPLFVADAGRGIKTATITHASGVQGALFRMAILS